jgi:hypothetical protein
MNKDERYDGTFLGYPLKATDASEEDCRRTDWHAKINGRWHEVNVGSLGDDFKDLDAAKTIIHVLQEDYDGAMKLVESWENKYAALATYIVAVEKYNEAISTFSEAIKELKELASDKQSQEEMAASMRNQA